MSLNPARIERDSIIGPKPVFAKSTLTTETVPPVAFISQGPITWASSRFRAAWVAEAAPDVFRWYRGDDDLALAGYQCLVFQKRYSDKDIALARAAKDRGVKIVFDMTDPLWWFDPKPVYAMMSIADAITVSSAGMLQAVKDSGLCDVVRHIDDRMNPAYHPTTVQHGERDVPTLAWFGQAGNRVGLIGALPILAYVANLGNVFKLRIIDESPTSHLDLDGPFEIEYVPWALETFHAQLTACDIAVLPPYPGPWGALKSENRAASAMWAGLPVIDGYNPGELVDLLTKPDLRAAQGKRNRDYAERHYDVAQSVTEWRDLLGELGVSL